MSKITQVFIRSFIGLFLLAFVLGGFDVMAQSVVTGDWRADVKADKPEKADKIYLSFERRTERGGRNQMGQSYSYAELQGLIRDQALNGGNIKFSLVREAGTIDCEGTFQDGKGSGTFRFTPNMQYISAMKSRGFDFEKTSSNNKYGDEREAEGQQRERGNDFEHHFADDIHPAPN